MLQLHKEELGHILRRTNLENLFRRRASHFTKNSIKWTKNVCLAWSKQHLSSRPLTKYTPKYRQVETHAIASPRKENSSNSYKRAMHSRSAGDLIQKKQYEHNIHIWLLGLHASINYSNEILLAAYLASNLLNLSKSIILGNWKPKYDWHSVNHFLNNFIKKGVD